jgi:hypothetical protein
MPRSEIPVDVLRIIFDLVDKADLVAICRVNKTCCFYAQNILYRDIRCGRRTFKNVYRTLARSAHLARRVRSFSSKDNLDSPVFATALRNMSSLRSLELGSIVPLLPNMFEGCTFKLDSFTCSNPDSEYLRKFLSSQPSLNSMTLYTELCAKPLDATCLPNLSRVTASISCLNYLIPGRPVCEVAAFGDISHEDPIDLGFFTLATAPIQKLLIDYSYLHPKTGHYLASIFPSLTHFTMRIGQLVAFSKDKEVCWNSLIISMGF